MKEKILRHYYQCPQFLPFADYPFQLFLMAVVVWGFILQ